MNYLQQSFYVKFEYKVYFTSGLFNSSNTLFNDFLKERCSAGTVQKILFVADQNVIDHHSTLINQINDYFATHKTIDLIGEVMVIPGGEIAKNDTAHFNRIVDVVNKYGIDRHSYLAAIGGGSVLDLAGYAAAISHRGLKHIRIPTTVLSQNDSGVGVKNGINFNGKKIFLAPSLPLLPFLMMSSF